MPSHKNIEINQSFLVLIFGCIFLQKQSGVVLILLCSCLRGLTVLTKLSKISQGVGMLKYSKKFPSLETVQKMYLGIVEPHIRCCCSVLGCAGDTILQKMAPCKSVILTEGLPWVKNIKSNQIKSNQSNQSSKRYRIEMIDFEAATMVYIAPWTCSSLHAEHVSQTV